MNSECKYDAAYLKDIYSHFPTGVVAVVGELNGALVGLTVSSFVPVSLDPPLVSFCVQNSSTTWPKLRKSPILGVSFLSEHQDSIAKKLSSKSDDRFVDIKIVSHRTAIYIEHATVWLGGVIEDTHIAGDHTIVVLRVLDIQLSGVDTPLIFYRSVFGGFAENVQFELMNK